LIEVNPEPTPLTPICDTSIRGTAGTVLPGLLRTVG
jgi:NAD-dependent SIR2 family protein deacetylase